MANDLDNNRLKRLRALDEILSSGKEVSMTQIIEKVKDSTGIESDRFALNRDLKLLDSWGFEVLRTKKSIRDLKNQQSRNVTLFKYKNPNTSLFKVELTSDEKNFLSEALSMLGLKGIQHQTFFIRLHLKANPNSKKRFISFTKNPIENQVSKAFIYIYEAIKHKNVIQIGVHERTPPYTVITHTVHPWYLHEYNRRWYLFGFDEEEQAIKRYTIDRIDKKPKIKEKITYLPATQTIDEILHDVVGVSVEDVEVMEVLFWVSDVSADYVAKKLIHHSQQELTREEAEAKLGAAIDYEGGKYFTIRCKENYELRREMLSFGPALVVLSPAPLRSRLKSQLHQMLEMYK